MCGFVGVLNRIGGEPPGQAVLERMASQIAHRGPDGQGYYRQGPVALAFRRLAIIDLARGHQPITSPCREGRYTIVFNGEIYNYQELREDLEKKRHRFATNSDTEVILHLFEDHQELALDRLSGMFAFAIWDISERRLFLARDRVGKKPLYYAELGAQFAFASEIKAITQFPGFSSPIDARALDHFLTFQAVPSPLTIFQKVRRLEPSHYLWVDLASSLPKPQRYWRLKFTPKFRGTIEDAKARLLEILKVSVRRRLIAEVPLGAFLSGGIDSSAVVAMMAQAQSKVKTFTIDFDEFEEKDFSEAKYARLVADKFGCEHTEFTVKADMTAELPRIIWHFDQPFADPSMVPSFFVAREARRAVTVALNGDGGDEAFAGYLRHAAVRLSQIASRSLASIGRRIAVWGLEHAPFPGAKLRRYCRRLGGALDPNPFETNFRVFACFDAPAKNRLYNAIWKNEVGRPAGREFMEQLAVAFEAQDPLDQILASDYGGYLPDCLLVKMDIATMAHSLEGRSPFLDHELVEFAATLPSDWKIRGIADTKWILRQTLKNTLPRSILGRRKMGFGAPVGVWLRRELKGLARRLLLEPLATQRGYFNPEEVRRLIDEHESGSADHSYRLWSLLCLELWHRVHIDKTLKPSDSLSDYVKRGNAS